MVAGDFAASVAAVPAWLQHAPGVGLTVADLVAPAFVLAIALTYRPSFDRRRADWGEAAAYRHFLLRYLALIGIGAILSAGGAVVDRATPWGVLQALGVAGIIALAVIRLGTWWRFAIGAALLGGYQLVLGAWALDAVAEATHGGFVGAIAWGAALVLATALADLWRRGLPAFALGIGAVGLAAAASALLVPIAKTRVSLSYVLVALTVAAAAFLLTDLGSRLVRDRPGLLAWWGENPLLLYLLHLVLLGALTLPAPAWLYADAPLWLAVVEALVLLALLTVVAWWLHRRRVRLRL